MIRNICLPPVLFSPAGRDPAPAFSDVYIWLSTRDHAIQGAGCEKCASGCRLRYQLKKTVVLVGMMGAGKTAVGTALARNLGVPFLDSDAEIEKAANMSIAEIFERDGEPFFRQKEAQVIARLLDTRRGILSTGGGAYLREENRMTISNHGVAVWLRASVELLWSRVRHKDSRPLLRTTDPRGTLAEMTRNREPYYARAEIVVDADAAYSVDEMAAKVMEALMGRPDVLVRR
jgi:shikimate kinase